MTPDMMERCLRGWVDFDAGNLPQRLSLAIRQLIETGVIAPGEQLPAERPLALALGVSRPTVSSALDELRSSGHVESRQGSGTHAALAKPQAPDREPFTGAVLGSRGINLAAAVPFDASHVPLLKLSADNLLASDPAHGVAPLGLEQLRTSAAQRFGSVGLNVSPENVLVTSGAHDALRTTFAALTTPSSVVLVDELAYGGIGDLANESASNLIGVPRDEHGASAEHLDEILRRTHPSLVLLAAAVHNPTGGTTTPQRLAELAEVLNHHQVPVVLDETYADLHYTARPRTLAAELEAPHVVIESLSKSVWSGLRIGWLTATPDLFTTITQRLHGTLGTSIPSQLLANTILTNNFDRFLSERRNPLATKSHHLKTLLSDAGSPWQVHPPEGGLATWIAVDATDTTITDAARRLDVHITPGSTFHVDGQPTQFVRACHDRPPDILTRAVERLAALW